jgi:outer membrane protein assembly factor BamB
LITGLGAFIHDAASCSVLLHGDLVYVTTSNGVDKAHEKVLAPEAPVLVALDRHTGRLAARENEGISARLFHAQWSSPSLGVVKGQPLVFLGGGDGVCYAFAALAKAGDGVAKLKQVWSYDGNPPGYRWRDGVPIRYMLGDKRKKDSPNKNDGAYVGPSDIIATPVFYQGRIYVGIGQDPAHGRGRGMFHCIDATRTGDITKTGCVWTFDGIERTMATAAVAEGLVYVTDIAGKLYCLEADTGRCVWTYDTAAETWGGPLIADGKIYVGNRKGLHILRTGRQAVLLDKVPLGAPAYSTPIAANGVLYVASQSYLWAVQNTR